MRVVLLVATLVAASGLATTRQAPPVYRTENRTKMPHQKVSQFVNAHSTFVTEWSKQFLDFLKQHLLLLLPGRGRLVPHKNPEEDGKSKPLRLSPRVVQFNVMVAGLSGLGKTTACNELFSSWRADRGVSLDETRYRPRGGRIDRRYGPSEVSRLDAPRHVPLQVDDDALASEVGVRPSSLGGRGFSPETTDVDDSRTFEYRDVKANTIVRVNIIDTPGFLGNPGLKKRTRGLVMAHPRRGVKTILDFTKKRRAEQFKAETSKNKRPAADKIVHCCLYFLSPHRFLQVDRLCLRELQKHVTVIPIIAKSDTMTNSELQEYRHWLNEEFKLQSIDVYSFDDDDARHVSFNNENKTSSFEDFAYVPLPRNRNRGDCLAVVGRDGFYAWGSSRAHNPDHSDLNVLRDALLSEHTEALVDLAKTRYADYRETRLRRAGLKNALKSVFVLAGVLRLAGLGTLGLGGALEAFAKDRLTALSSLSSKSKRAKDSGDDDDAKRKQRHPVLAALAGPGSDDDADSVMARGKNVMAVVGGVIGLYLLAPSPF